MLSALQVKHAHLRGSSLRRSLLVIDEVHASDPYMTEVTANLLEDHLSVGGYAMLMSATLGARARVRYTGESLPDFNAACSASYPAVWVLGEESPRTAGDSGYSRSVDLESVPTMDPAEAASRAVRAAQQGARVLVVRNTVGKAIETWRAVRETSHELLLMTVDGHPALHHSRFAAEDRDRLDGAVEELLRPGRDRTPRGRIVIGTQTLEQSLDIDADHLITDLCPVDVLLQRLGRLHRHPDTPRPEGFENPRAEVLVPEKGLDPLAEPGFDNGLGGWKTKDGSLDGIYTDLPVLEWTRRLIDSEPTWRIPEMNRGLVEGATHPERTDSIVTEKGEAWQRYDELLEGVRAAQGRIAELNVLDRSQPFGEGRFPGSDEHVTTRLGGPGAILDLPEPSLGPFGTPVSRFRIPSHWSSGLGQGAPIEVERKGEALILSIAGRRFRYAVEGLDVQSAV